MSFQKDAEAKADRILSKINNRGLDKDLSNINKKPIEASKHAKLYCKSDLSLLPLVFESGVSHAMMAGEIKYGRNNYKAGHKITDLLAAIKRHTGKILEGEDIDADCTKILRDGFTRPCGTFIPGLGDKAPTVYHLDCIGASVLMLKEQTRLGTLKDNRYKE